MNAVLILVGPLLTGSVIGWLVAANVRDRPTKSRLMVAIGASVVLCYVALLLSTCGLSENGALVHPGRCEEGKVQLLPLAGIPILILLAVFAGQRTGPMPWIAGAVIFLVAIVVPWYLIRY